MTSARTDQLGRGVLTRWLPVLWQASSAPPDLGPFDVPAGTTPARFQVRVLTSAKKLTVPAAALSVAHQVGEALVPVIAGLAIDRALATGDTGQLALWLALLGLNFLVLSLAFRFSAQLTARAAETAQHRLRATLSARVLHAADGRGRQPEGAVVSTMTNDVTRIGMLGLAVFPIGELAGVLFIAGSLLGIHWPLGLAVLLGAPVVVWLMGRLSGSYARASRTYQNLLAQTVGRATDLVTGYRVIKGVRAEAEATRRYHVVSRQTRDGAYRSVESLGRYLTGSDALSGTFMAGVAGLAGWFAIRGDLSVGELIAAVGLAQALLPPMQMLTGNAVPLWAAAVASSGRVLDILGDSPASTSPELAHPAPSGSQAVTDVPPLDLEVPGHDPVRVAPGELIGIRADDATATRLARALLHPRSDTGVRVRVAGRPAETLPSASYRAQVVVAPHHAALFSGTIADNITVTGTSDEGARTAITGAAGEDFVAAAGGPGASVGEMGNRLSGGQRQRLALARALSSEAAVLVLHDPTTAVDSVTEATIGARLGSIRPGRSTVLIASSPVLLAACDRIVDLHESTEAPA